MGMGKDRQVDAITKWPRAKIEQSSTYLTDQGQDQSTVRKHDMSWKGGGRKRRKKASRQARRISHLTSVGSGIFLPGWWW